MLQATCTQKMASLDAHKTVKTTQLGGHCSLPFPVAFTWGRVTVCAHCCPDCFTPRLSTTFS